MIKFFRHIRKQLFSEEKTGRFSKYLLYAFGEIFLVVIGILIAIQLNTLKSKADDEAKVLKYMDGLYHDLNQDLERMNELFTFYSDNTSSIQFLLKSADQKLTLSNDELGTLFNSALDYRKYTNKKSTYLSLINDGFINKINDEDLINAIIVYYETPYLAWSTEIYGNIAESIDFNTSDIYDSRDGLIGLNESNSIPNWQMTNNQYHTNYSELINSTWGINILTRFLKQSHFIFINLETYKLKNAHLRNEIENYKKVNS
ncbi:DUF6090 family protein [Namhaeicola litoreus]|uniref:DUF6090 family protein n=1 Tax=Namhaeicola litoreus TaxID=1052145 RepID=A0ABW3Y135_9FLAO